MSVDVVGAVSFRNDGGNLVGFGELGVGMEVGDRIVLEVFNVFIFRGAIAIAGAGASSGVTLRLLRC